MKIDASLCPFPLILKRLRKENSLSQFQLGKRIGRHHSTIALWEAQATYPNLIDLVLLSIALKSTLPELSGLHQQNSVIQDLTNVGVCDNIKSVESQWGATMAFELVEKQARGESTEERVSISANGRTFIVSSATMKKSFGGAEKVLIFIDKNAAGNEVKIGFLPTNEIIPDAYSVVRPRRSNSGYIMAKSTLAKVGYNHNKLYSREVEWVERPINGKKTGILEFGIERKYLK